MSAPMGGPVAVAGFVAPGFEGVRDAFVANFDPDRNQGVADLGAAVSVVVDGAVVVDLWGGAADATSGRRWDEDTLVIVFSVTKGLTAMCAHLLVERGLLDLDAPVAHYWPEFAAAGKADVPVRWLLGHRVGLPHVEGEFTLDEVLAWTPVVEALAASAPQWEPGTRHGYHMRSYGWLVGEVIRRITGTTVGAFWRESFAEPLGLDTWIGLPDHHHDRCAAVVPPPPSGVDLTAIFGADSLTARVLTGPDDLFHYDEMWNEPAIRRAELPSSNGHTDARSLARAYAACVGEVDGGVRSLRPATIAAAVEVQSRGADAILFVESCFGLGFTRPPFLPPSCRAGAFGHGGAGGSLGFADPDHRVGFGYVMNRLRFDLDDRRADRLVGAVYDAIGAAPPGPVPVPGGED